MLWREIISVTSEDYGNKITFKTSGSKKTYPKLINVDNLCNKNGGYVYWFRLQISGERNSVF